MPDITTFVQEISLLNDEITKYYRGLEAEKGKAIYDGIVNKEEYYASPVKILWILKEPYDKDNEGESEWNLADLLGTEDFLDDIGGATTTWHPIIYTTFSILNNINYDDMDFIKDNPSMVDVLKKVAFMNIHKFPAGTTSKNSEISAAYSRDKTILLKQIETYKPDIVIGGNVMHNFIDDLGLKDYGNYKEYEYWIKDRRLYIDANHPAYPKSVEAKEAYTDDILRIVRLFNEQNSTDETTRPN